jgi:hypothetical protein
MERRTVERRKLELVDAGSTILVTYTTYVLSGESSASATDAHPHRRKETMDLSKYLPVNIGGAGPPVLFQIIHLRPEYLPG